LEVQELHSVPAKVAVVVTIVVLTAAGGWYFGKRHAESLAYQARIPPVEFLYLDGDRILGFLAEMEGGETGPIRRISKDIKSVDASASEGGFAVGASAQHETAAESTLTRTESSALDLLLDDLHENDRHGIRVHAISLNGPGALKQVKEGMLVRFVTHYLLSPGYIRPYVVVRQSATLAALFPQAPGNSADARRSKLQRRLAESFAHKVGPDPRLTFAVSPPTPAGEPALKLLMPMHYHGLTDERSLLEKGRDDYTGGRLVVVGKVVRVFEHKTAIHCQEEHRCQAPEGVPEYIDYATREIWRHPLETASNYLIRHVSHSCEVPLTEVEKEVELESHPKLSEDKIEPLRGRPCFLDKLSRQTELFSPGAVIVPIAIYK
jgi:hypothetical protein